MLRARATRLIDAYVDIPEARNCDVAPAFSLQTVTVLLCGRTESDRLSRSVDNSGLTVNAADARTRIINHHSQRKGSSH